MCEMSDTLQVSRTQRDYGTPLQSVYTLQLVTRTGSIVMWVPSPMNHSPTMQRPESSGQCDCARVDAESFIQTIPVARAAHSRCRLAKLRGRL